jgi:hypothetical protein
MYKRYTRLVLAIMTLKCCSRHFMLLTAMVLLAPMPQTFCAGGDTGKQKSPPRAPDPEFHPSTSFRRWTCMQHLGIADGELLTETRINQAFKPFALSLHPDKCGGDESKMEKFKLLSAMRDDLIQEVQHGLQFLTDEPVYANRRFVQFRRAGAGAAAGGAAAGGAAGGGAAGGCAAAAARSSHTAEFWREAAEKTFGETRSFEEILKQRQQERADRQAMDAKQAREAALAAEKKAAAEKAKRLNDFWEEAIAYEAQRLNSIADKKLRAETAKRWASDRKTYYEEQRRLEEAEQRLHQNATEAAQCLMQGFCRAQQQQKETYYFQQEQDRARKEAMRKDRHWELWFEAILAAGFDVFDFCDASFAPLDETAFEEKAAAEAFEKAQWEDFREKCRDIHVAMHEEEVATGAAKAEADPASQRPKSPIIISSDEESICNSFCDEQDASAGMDVRAAGGASAQNASAGMDVRAAGGASAQNASAGMDVRGAGGASAQNASAGMDVRGAGGASAQNASAGMDVRESGSEDGDGVMRVWNTRKRKQTDFYKPPPKAPR